MLRAVEPDDGRGDRDVEPQHGRLVGRLEQVDRQREDGGGRDAPDATRTR